MSWLFGKRPKPERALEKQQRALNKALREMEREKKRMDREEEKLIFEIKKAARLAQMDTVKILAKDLVRTRRFAKKLTLLKANIQAISLKFQTTKSQFAMTQATQGVTIALQNMNRQMNLPLVTRILREFTKHSGIMDLKDETTNAAINGAVECDDDDDESDAVIAQVLDELGLQLSDQLSGLPHASSSICQQKANRPNQSPAQTVEEKEQHAMDIDADIQARLDKLRRN